MERLHKLLANHGVGSRRRIEEMIRDGLIEVNGSVAQIGDKASVTDFIRINGKPLSLRQAIRPMVLLCHKPCGFLVTHNDKDERRTVFSLLPKASSGKWIAVGRLDINTSGLLIVCNDGELANRLMHPSYRIEREYHVRVSGHADTPTLDILRSGVALDGRSARFRHIELLRCSDANSWYKVVLCEGRNREVRRLWQSQGFVVSRLKRVRFGAIQLDLPSGAWRQLQAGEAARLYTSVGLANPLLPAVSASKAIHIVR